MTTAERTITKLNKKSIHNTSGDQHHNLNDIHMKTKYGEAY